MTRDDVIRMAREAGFTGYDSQSERLHDFAALVRDYLLSTEIHSCHNDCQRFACIQTRRAVEAEREACAKVADYMSDFAVPHNAVAIAIRARGNNES